MRYIMKSSLNIYSATGAVNSIVQDSNARNKKIERQNNDKYSSFVKRTFDVALASSALIFLFPMFLILCVVLLISQGRPIFIKHKRVGRSGASFGCLKFRSMVTNADDVLKDHLSKNPEVREEWEATRKLKSDPRITQIGAFLRKSSVDELPQLFNIIRGEMSVVGPRPIVQDEVRYYGDDFIHYTKLRPGLTGLWQVSGRNDVSYKTRVQLDVRYSQQCNLYNDVVIIAKTIPAVLRSKGCY